MDQNELLRQIDMDADRQSAEKQTVVKIIRNLNIFINYFYRHI